MPKGQRQNASPITSLGTTVGTDPCRDDCCRLWVSGINIVSNSHPWWDSAWGSAHPHAWDLYSAGINEIVLKSSIWSYPKGSWGNVRRSSCPGSWAVLHGHTWTHLQGTIAVLWGCRAVTALLRSKVFLTQRIKAILAWVFLFVLLQLQQLDNENFAFFFSLWAEMVDAQLSVARKIRLSNILSFHSFIPQYVVKDDCHLSRHSCAKLCFRAVSLP